MSDLTATVTCKSFPEHPENCDTVNITRRVFGAFSCVSCIFVIFIIWLFKRYTAFAQRQILYLTIAAFLNGLGRLVQDSTNHPGAWCAFQAFWLNYFNYAVMLWVVCITVNLFMNVIRDITTTHLERWYHAVCWLLSLAVSLLPFIGNHYGPSGSWCWIINDTGWQMGIWYVPLFIILFTLLVAYGYIVFTLYRKATAWTGSFDPTVIEAQERLKKEAKPLRLYPFVFLLLSVFPLVNRIHNAVSDEEHVLALVMLHAISASVQGAAYALVFAIDRDTLRSLTPINIKTAILKKYAPPVVVQEYPVAVVCMEDRAGSTTENTAGSATESAELSVTR